MINSKEDYKKYLKVEKEAYHKCYPNFTYEHKILIKFLKLYRTVEYYHNCRTDFLGRIYYQILLRRYQHKEIKYQIFLGLNSIDMGFRIVHIGPIYIHENCQIGKNVKIHPMVVISKPLGHNDNYPIIGDGVWIGPGTKIFGKIKIGDQAVIGANSLVNKNVEAHTTYAGNPAQKINAKGYEDYFKQG